MEMGMEMEMEMGRAAAGAASLGYAQASMQHGVIASASMPANVGGDGNSVGIAAMPTYKGTGGASSHAHDIAAESTAATTATLESTGNIIELTPSTAKFLRAFKSPAPASYNAKSVAVDSSIRGTISQKRVQQDVRTRKAKVLEIQKVAKAKKVLSVESTNTKPIEKAVASRRQPRIGRAGLRSMTTEPFIVPRVVKEQIETEAAAEVLENTIKSRELAGWQQPVTRARPAAGPPSGVLKINRLNRKKARRARKAKKRQVDPELRALLHVLDQPHLKDPL